MQPLFLLVQHFPPMVVQQFVFSFLLLISPCLGCIATVSPDDGRTTTTASTSTISPTSTTTVTTTTTTTAACLAGWVFFPTTNFCYLLLDSMGRTPAASQSYCQSLTTGSNLVSMHSQAENDFVVSLTSPGLPAKRVLVGAERIAPVGNAFAYLDNSPYDYNNFIVGEPNNYLGLESCVTMSTDVAMILSVVYPRGTWNDVPCTDPFDYFVCKAPKL